MGAWIKFNRISECAHHIDGGENIANEQRIEQFNAMLNQMFLQIQVWHILQSIQIMILLQELHVIVSYKIFHFVHW